MPFYRGPLEKKCKYCDRDTRVYILNGRNKGYYKTCGSKECRSKAMQIAGKKRVFEDGRLCEHCGNSYIARSARQKWCVACVPNKTSSARLRRYGMSQSEFEAQKAAQNHLCAICQEGVPTEVDHDHQTGYTREILCARCNILLGHLENTKWRQAAEKYLEKHNAIQVKSTSSIF